MTEPRYWIAVASGEHVRRGATRDGIKPGFMQVCHGKSQPLLRIKPGDGVVYYSPTVAFGGKEPLQAFTAIGRAEGDIIYQVDMGEGFQPFRRNVAYMDAQVSPIRPLLERLEFTRGKRNWGYAFRFGLVEISRVDFEEIAKAMGAKV